MKTMGILTITILGVFSFLQAGPGKKSSELTTRIDTYLSAGVAHGFSGSMLVAKKGEVIFKKGYGQANREKSQAFTPETITTIGSVTKQFTGTAILKLVAAKKLKLTDTLGQFFDQVPADKKDITLHQLLTHSSGLVGGIGQGDFDHISTEAYFKTLFATPLQYKPGSRHRYSNAGYSILGRVIEKVSGQSYETFLQEQLFQPAGMQETGYLKPKWDHQRLANGYAGSVFDLGTLISRFRKDGKLSWNLKANGGIHSTLDDMFKWYQALRGNKILTPAFTEKLTKPYIAEDEEGSSHYAYGWAIFTSARKTKIVSHNGGNGVYFFDFLWLPEEDVAIIFATNSIIRETDGMAWRVERMMFDAAYQPKPYGENPNQMVFQYIEKHPASMADSLFQTIQTNHAEAFKHPRILNRMGYMLMRWEKDPQWVVAVFEKNTQLFPENDNVWDSLGDGYLAAGDKQKAMASFKKSAEMGNEYSLEKLKELQAEK